MSSVMKSQAVTLHPAWGVNHPLHPVYPRHINTHPTRQPVPIAPQRSDWLHAVTQCLCSRHPLLRNHSPKSWNSGAAIQICQRSRKVLPSRATVCMCRKKCSTNLGYYLVSGIHWGPGLYPWRIGKGGNSCGWLHIVFYISKLVLMCITIISNRHNISVSTNKVWHLDFLYLNIYSQIQFKYPSKFLFQIQLSSFKDT